MKPEFRIFVETKDNIAILQRLDKTPSFKERWVEVEKGNKSAETMASFQDRIREFGGILRSTTILYNDRQPVVLSAQEAIKYE
ncbi:MAG: hypothetical protein WCP97_00615 [bacterium]